MENTGTKNHSDDKKDCNKLHLDDPFSLFLDRLHLPLYTALDLEKETFGNIVVTWQTRESTPTQHTVRV